MAKSIDQKSAETIISMQEKIDKLQNTCKENTHTIVFVEGGLVQRVCANSPDVILSIVDLDNVQSDDMSEEDIDEAVRLTNLCGTEEYTDIY